MTEREDDLNEALHQFHGAEEALRSILESADQLRTAGDELAEARSQLGETVAESVQRLDNAEKSVADTASAIFRLADELKDSARNLGDTAQALIRIGPERLFEDIAAIKSKQEDLAAHIAALTEAHQNASAERQSIRETLRRSQLWVIGFFLLLLIVGVLSIVN